MEQPGNITPDTWVAEHLQLLPGNGLVLDLACGKGRHSRALLDAGFAVLAVDRDITGVREIQHPQLEVLQYDLESGPWPFPPELFDGMVVCNYLHRPLLPHLASSLKPGGVLIYTTFMRGNEAFGRPRNPDFLLKPDELKVIFNDSMEELDFRQGQTGTPPDAVKQSAVLRKTPEHIRLP